ncbi:MAG: hypothetical protein KW802_01835 [Candidatus Doudnabacteria bacterium]|nr:hypothetical protein [Candidatus Doudnabacteria bacterium]
MPGIILVYPASTRVEREAGDLYEIILIFHGQAGCDSLTVPQPYSRKTKKD